MSGLLRPARMSLEEKLLGLVAYENWRKVHLPQTAAREAEGLSVPQAAELLGVTRQRVLQLVESGALPAQRFGRMWVIPRDAVEARSSR